MALDDQSEEILPPPKRLARSKIVVALPELEGLVPRRSWPQANSRLWVAFLAVSLFVHSIAIGTLAWIIPDRDGFLIPSPGGRSSAGSRPSMSASPEGTAREPTYFRVLLPSHQLAVREKPPETQPPAQPTPPPPKPEPPDPRPPEPADVALEGLSEAELSSEMRQSNALPLLVRRPEDAQLPGSDEYHLKPLALKRAVIEAYDPPETVTVEAHAVPRPPRTDNGRNRVAELAYAPVVSEPMPGELPSRGAGGDGMGHGSGAIYTPTPAYPPGALAARQTGRVLIRLTVNADGSVRDAAVRESSGVPALDDAALSTLRQWQFVGRPRDWTLVVPVRFALGN